MQAKRTAVILAAAVFVLAAGAAQARTTHYDRTFQVASGRLVVDTTPPYVGGSVVSAMGVWVDGHPAALVSGGNVCTNNYLVGGVFVRIAACAKGDAPVTVRIANATTRRHRVRVLLTAGPLGEDGTGLT